LARELVRHSHAAGSNERERRLESRLPHVCAEVVSKVCAVSQIEHLKERSYRVAFFDSEVLANARVQLEESLATQIVEVSNLALARPKTISIEDRVGGDAWIAERRQRRL